MVQDQYGVLADDRVNNQLDFSKINSKEDYIREVKKYLENTISGFHGTYQGKRLIPYIDRMYEDSEAKDIVEEKQSENLRKAQLFEKTRAKKRRKRDELITAKRTRIATKKSVRRWKKKPFMSDIKGVDTRLSKTARRRQQLITKRDLGLRTKDVGVGVNVKGIKQYRSLKTGRFIKKPF